MISRPVQNHQQVRPCLNSASGLAFASLIIALTYSFSERGSLSADSLLRRPSQIHPTSQQIPLPSFLGVYCPLAACHARAHLQTCAARRIQTRQCERYVRDALHLPFGLGGQVQVVHRAARYLVCCLMMALRGPGRSITA